MSSTNSQPDLLMTVTLSCVGTVQGSSISAKNASAAHAPSFAVKAVTSALRPCETRRPLCELGPLDVRRGTLSVISIGVPIVIGLLTGQTGPGLVGGITGLLLTLSDTEGSLSSRLGTTAGVASGIAIGALLGAWLATVQPIFWTVFFIGIFAAGLLNRAGRAHTSPCASERLRSP
jgi:hypothetical protein